VKNLPIIAVSVAVFLAGLGCERGNDDVDQPAQSVPTSTVSTDAEAASPSASNSPQRALTTPDFTYGDYAYSLTLYIAPKTRDDKDITCGHWAGDPPDGAYYIPVIAEIIGKNSGNSPVPFFRVFFETPGAQQETFIHMSDSIGAFNENCISTGADASRRLIPPNGVTKLAGAIAISPKEDPSKWRIGVSYLEGPLTGSKQVKQMSDTKLQ